MDSKTSTPPPNTEEIVRALEALNSFGRRNRVSKREKKQGDQGGQPQPGQQWPQKQGGQPGQQWPAKPAIQPERKPTTWPTQPGQGH